MITKTIISKNFNSLNKQKIYVYNILSFFFKLPEEASATALAMAELETVLFLDIMSSNSASDNGGGASTLISVVNVVGCNKIVHILDI